MPWLNPVTLTGQYGTLIPLATEHCEELITAAKDGELWNLWYATVAKPEDMPAEIERRLAMQARNEMLPFTVIDNKTQTAAGMTTYCFINEKDCRLEFGWTWYRKSLQKTALNTECKLLLLQHAFEELNCVNVATRVNFYNFNSRRAVERLGAKQDGIFRNYRMMNGILCDFYFYSINNTEWPAVKKHLQCKLAESTITQ